MILETDIESLWALIKWLKKSSLSFSQIVILQDLLNIEEFSFFGVSYFMLVDIP